MSFLIGFSFIILLSIFTILLYMVAKRLPAEFALTSIVIMLAGDAVLVALWYYGLIEIVETVKHFRLGISGAFCTAAMGRAIYFMLSYDEKVQ